MNVAPIIQNIFALKGRLNRLQFFVLLFLNVLLFAGLVSVYAQMGLASHSGTFTYIGIIPIWLVFGCIEALIVIKRLRDAGKSLWWAALIMLFFLSSNKLSGAYGMMLKTGKIGFFLYLLLAPSKQAQDSGQTDSEGEA